MKVKISFEGGLQDDFGAPDGLDLTLKDGSTLTNLICELVPLLKKPDARFVDKTGTLANGILSMVNDVDSEVPDESGVAGLGRTLKDGDHVTFISMLHGG